MRLVVVAAWEPELERFRALVGPGFDPHVELEAVGIGVVDAALGTMRCIAQHRPDRVVLLGTCGASPGSGLAIGDVIAASAVELVDPAAAEGRAAMPYASDPVRFDPAMVAELAAAGARPARVMNTLGVTTDDALAGVLAARGDVEHLEAYAVARACEAAAIPCAAALGVANIVGARGREQWRARHVEASARAADVALAALRTSTTARSPA